MGEVCFDPRNKAPVAVVPGPTKPPADLCKEAPVAAAQAPQDQIKTQGQPRKGIPAVSPETESIKEEKPAARYPRKGTAFGYWGYNRADYTKSNLHMFGPGYDITLNNAKATDKFGFDGYGDFFRNILRTEPTIPQYNYRFGYYFDDKHSVSVGQDHMKYQLAPQMADVTGMISPEASAQYAGTYNHTPLAVGENGNAISEYEHCDGLNYIDAEIAQTENLWVSANGKHAVSVIGSVGAGIIITDTHAEIFGDDHDHHRFRVDGVGASGSVGLRADIYRHFFVEGQVKGGYINLYDVKTVGDGVARQQFGFLQRMIVVGVNIPIERKKHAKPQNPLN